MTVLIQNFKSYLEKFDTNIVFYFVCFPAKEFNMDEEQNQSQNDDYVDENGFVIPEDELDNISAEIQSQREKKRKIRKAPNKATYTMIRLKGLFKIKFKKSVTFSP